MGSKRSAERMERLRQRLYAGMAERGITGAVADEICDKLAAFANFGFPESHSVSFAYLVYASAWIKLHYPAAFCAGLLNAQPMGFYSPHSLVQDARRHGVEVRTPDINASGRRRHPRAAATAASAGLAVRLGSSVRCAGSATTWPSGSPPAALRGHGGRGPPRRPHARPARGAGHRRAFATLAPARPDPDQGRDRGRPRLRPAAQAHLGGRGGGPGGADRLAGIVTGVEAPHAAGHGRPGGGPGRPVGHRGLPRRPPHPVRAGRPRPAGVVPASGLAARPTAPGSWWAGW